MTGTGARLYNQKISSVREEIDDAFVQLWLADDAIGQIQVSRNHVAGYRNETSIYGEEGMIRVGHFQEDPLKVQFEAYGRGVLIERRSFRLRDYGDGVPVFIQRFGPAYKAEVAHFAEQCMQGGIVLLVDDLGPGGAIDMNRPGPGCGLGLMGHQAGRVNHHIGMAVCDTINITK